MASKQTSEVFGISSDILPDSYVDRGALDARIATLLMRSEHVAIRGASKSGKSWLRKRMIPKAIVIQCRLGKTVEDIYREALGQIGIKLEVSRTSSHSLAGNVEASSEIGAKLISKVAAKLGLSGQVSGGAETANLRHNINDLDFICDLLGESERRLVIEDFHYLSASERKRLAFDMKAMWDLGFHVVIVGVWSDNNLLLDLNPELSGRVREVSVAWSKDELSRVLEAGSSALNIRFDRAVSAELIDISYGSVGILQRLTLDTLDAAQIYRRRASTQLVDDLAHVQNAAMFYAEELNSVYQRFAATVSQGIRTRKNSTGIYAHALAVVLESSDLELAAGISLARIYEVAHSRERRIQQGNLKTALGNLERLQVDEDGRGLVLSFADGRVRVVDKQLLLYRRFATVQWPWEEMIAQAEAAGEDYVSISE